MPVNPIKIQNRAEALASRLPPLLLEAEKIAATVAQGMHGLRRAGQGDNFWQYRPYLPGDPASIIDWRRSARAEDLFVRQKEWEAPQTLWLWADTSMSMVYRSKKKFPSKVRRGALLLLAISALLARSGERFTILASGLPPMTGKHGLYRATEFMIDEKRRTENLPPYYILPRHSQVVFIGDFLSPIRDIRKLIQSYAAISVKGHILQVFDPAEIDLPFRGRAIFEGLEEDDGWLEVKRADALRESYARRAESHRQGLELICKQAGWSYSFHRTDRAPEKALMELYLTLSQRRVV